MPPARACIPPFWRCARATMRPLVVGARERPAGGRVDLGWRARGYAHSRVQLNHGASRFELEMLTMLAARSRDTGELRASLPVTAAGPHGGRETGPVPELIELAKAARQQVPHHDTFAGSVLGRSSRDRAPLGDRQLRAFSATSTSTAQGSCISPLTSQSSTPPSEKSRGTWDGLAESADWALSTSTVRRDIFYYANIALGQKVCSQVMSIERSDDLVTTHTRLVREADGLLMADVITAKAIVASLNLAVSFRTWPSARRASGHRRAPWITWLRPPHSKIRGPAQGGTTFAPDEPRFKGQVRRVVGDARKAARPPRIEPRKPQEIHARLGRDPPLMGRVPLPSKMGTSMKR